MTGPELALALAPMVNVSGRQQLRALHQGSTVQFRYDHINDWDRMGAFMREHDSELDLHDGQEWFVLTIRGSSVCL